MPLRINYSILCFVISVPSSLHFFHCIRQSWLVGGLIITFLLWSTTITMTTFFIFVFLVVQSYRRMKGHNQHRWLVVLWLEFLTSMVTVGMYYTREKQHFLVCTLFINPGYLFLHIASLDVDDNELIYEYNVYIYIRK